MKVHLLPYFRLDLQVGMTVDEAQQRLVSSLYPRRPWRLFWQRRPSGFEGVVLEDGGFRLNRIISGQNSFVPFVYGRIESANGGSRVRVFASLHPAVATGLLAFVTFLLYSLIRGFLTADGRAHTTTAVAVPLVFLAFVYVLTMSSFWIEAPKVRGFLVRVFST